MRKCLKIATGFKKDAVSAYANVEHGADSASGLSGVDTFTLVERVTVDKLRVPAYLFLSARRHGAMSASAITR